MNKNMKKLVCFLISTVFTVCSCSNVNKPDEKNHLQNNEEDINFTAKTGKNKFKFICTDEVKKSNVTYSYDSNIGSIKIVSTGATADNVSGSTKVTVNGQTEYYDYVFQSDSDRYIAISSNCSVQQTHRGVLSQCFMQVTLLINGRSVRYGIKENNFVIHLHEGEEIGIRFFVSKGWKGDLTFYPQVELGTHCTEFECYVNDDLTDETSLENEWCRYKKSTKPIITFIDDDTNSVELINRYYNALNRVGVVGNYAVITNNMLKNEGEKELLLSLEKKGFGCLYHCAEQRGDKPTSPGAYYLEDYRDMQKVEENFLTGLREMQTAGFSAYKYWVSPYGVDDEEILTIPRKYGFNCLITLSQKGFISPANCDRWHIPRWHLSPGEVKFQGLEYFKKLVDVCVADHGWLVVVTHVNEWDTTTTMDDALSEAAQYALDFGMEVRNFPDAFEIYRPFFYMNEVK